MKPLIFISYSSEDLSFAKKIRDALENTKAISVWQDNLSIRTGDVLYDEIQKAIEQITDICLFYLSETALNSKWVRQEYEIALQKKKSIIYHFIDNEATRKKLSLWPELAGNTTRIPVINESKFYDPLLEFVSTLLSKYYKNLYPKINIDSVLEASSAKGIHSIQHGRFTKKDDERMEELILGSSHIRIMMLNGSSFFAIFRKTLLSFLSKDNVKLNLLLADEESIFYNENSVLVHKGFDNNEANKTQVKIAIKRAISIWEDTGKKNILEIRQFNTQFRLPIIIFDDKVALLTINLPPGESIEGMTLEFQNISDSSYIKECIRHFDAVWNVSKEHETKL